MYLTQDNNGNAINNTNTIAYMLIEAPCDVPVQEVQKTSSNESCPPNQAQQHSHSMTLLTAMIADSDDGIAIVLF